MASNPNRRPPLDFDGNLSAGTPGLNDVKKGLSKPTWMGEAGVDELGKGLTVIESAGRRNGRQAPPESV